MFGTATTGVCWLNFYMEKYMEIVIGVLFVGFMFLVDWRLSKIHRELESLNETMKRGDK